jgi:SAM-dependent methyltransferase
MVADPESWWLDELSSAGREHLDEQHARRYDAKEDAQASEEIRRLQDHGVLDAAATVVDLGAGTGQFALAAAGVCRRVIAVDVSPVMLAPLTEKIEARGPPNVELVRAGFLTYAHEGAPADLVYSRYALHHLPDFWKAIALRRAADMLRPGGVLRLWDVVYGFEPAEAERRIDAWIERTMAADVEGGWTRSELAEHVRDEHSTFTWLLEPMIERAGFAIVDAQYSDDRIFARYVCAKRRGDPPDWCAEECRGSLPRMPSFEYTTTVLTHGLLGRKEEELDRAALEQNLNEMGTQGWELVKVLTHMALHREKDGHLLLFKRRLD